MNQPTIPRTSQQQKPAATTLSPLLQEISDVVGLEATLKFAAACGGTRVYIPARLPKEHWITEAIGRDLAPKLCAHFTYDRRGIHLDMPLYPLALQIQELHKSGLSAREIALKLGITQRTVHRSRHLNSTATKMEVS
jgi:DNA-binding NarL/FixJ family response regulator